MTQQQFTSPYRKNASDLRDLTLWQRNRQGGNASWRIRIAGNKVRFTVYPGIEGDNKSITGNISPRAYFVFNELLQLAIDTPIGTAKTYKAVMKRKNQKGDLVNDFEIYTGRNEDGIVWVSLFRYERPKVQFLLKDDNYTQYEHVGGEAFTKGEVSTLVAKGYKHMFEFLVGGLMISEFVEEEEKNGGGGSKGGYQNRNNGGGYNKGGNGGNNYSKGNNQSNYNNRDDSDDYSGSSSSSAGMDEIDDDIPY